MQRGEGRYEKSANTYIWDEETCLRKGPARPCPTRASTGRRRRAPSAKRESRARWRSLRRWASLSRPRREARHRRVTCSREASWEATLGRRRTHSYSLEWRVRSASTVSFANSEESVRCGESVMWVRSGRSAQRTSCHHRLWTRSRARRPSIPVRATDSTWFVYWADRLLVSRHKRKLCLHYFSIDFGIIRKNKPSENK